MKSQLLIIVLLGFVVTLNTEIAHANRATQVVINMLLLDDDDTRIKKDVSMAWVRPFERENNTNLSASEIDHYQIRYRKLGAPKYRFLIIYPPTLNADLTLRGEVDDQYELSIRVIDTAGLSSNYTDSVVVTFGMPE